MYVCTVANQIFGPPLTGNKTKEKEGSETLVHGYTVLYNTVLLQVTNCTHNNITTLVSQCGMNELWNNIKKRYLMVHNNTS